MEDSIMYETLTVARRSSGLVASLDADRMAADFSDAGADAAGAADGAQPSHDDAHLDETSDDGADGSPDAGEGDPDRAAAGDESDDEEFDDEDDPTADPAERAKKLKNALKKAKSKLSKSRPIREYVKQLRDRGIALEDLYADAREYRRLMQLAERNPRLRGLLVGSDAPDDAPARTSADRRPAPASEEFQFDESFEALGFDPNESKANRVLANGLKRIAQLEHQLTTTLARLQPDQLVDRVNKLDQTFRQQTTAQINREWSEAITAAARYIKDPDQRKVFGDLMLSAKQAKAGQAPAKFFVDHYLKLLKVNPAQADQANRAVAAQRNRVAQRVAELPRPAGQNGTAAPARRTRELVSDVHKRIRSIGR
jgi:hypothetical protein